MKPAESKYFYQKLPAEKKFRYVLDHRRYSPLPEDWVVVVADIKSSTQAIERGDYKSVNLLGVAVIVVAQGVLKKLDFPYIFGGDGSNLVVPSEFCDHLKEEYIKLKRLALSHFNLELRVGFVPVSELKEKGADIMVAKFKLTGKRYLAAFIGGGISYAEKLVKQENSPYETPIGTSANVNLGKLTCLWKPFQTRFGVILSLIIQNVSLNKNYLPQLYEEIEKVFSEGLENANPVNPQSMELNSRQDNLKKELQMNANLFSFTAIQKIIAVFLMPVLKIIYTYSPIFRGYIYSFPQHTDFRKVDGTLKLTLDCTPRETEAIHEILDRYSTETKIIYGSHSSREVYMTCFVEKMKKGEHIHFVDGTEGGYAMAALQLKKKLLTH